MAIMLQVVATPKSAQLAYMFDYYQLWRLEKDVS